MLRNSESFTFCKERNLSNLLAYHGYYYYNASLTRDLNLFVLSFLILRENVE